jgi:hypothetical protein
MKPPASETPPDGGNTLTSMMAQGQSNIGLLIQTAGALHANPRLDLRQSNYEFSLPLEDRFTRVCWRILFLPFM